MANSILDTGDITAMWLWEPDWSEEVALQGLLSKTVMQYGGSSWQLWVENYEIPKRLKMKFFINSKVKEKELLDFFTTQMGRCNKFWIPTWLTQFTPLDDINDIDVTIPVQNHQFTQNYRGYERLFILLHNGDMLVRKITGVSVVDVDEVLTISSALGRDIQTTDIAHCGLFMLARFDNDKIDLEYVTSTYSKTTLKFYELIREYP